MIPAVPGKAVSIHDALEQVPELKAAYDEAEYLRGLIDTAGEDGRRGAQRRHARRGRGGQR